MVVYAFTHNSCIHESADYTVSLHLSYAGAEAAKKDAIEEAMRKWQELVDSDEDRDSPIGYAAICPFGEDERWNIVEMEVLP